MAGKVRLWWRHRAFLFPSEVPTAAVVAVEGATAPRARDGDGGGAAAATGDGGGAAAAATELRGVRAL